MIDLLVTEEIKEKLEENPEKAAEIINSNRRNRYLCY